MITTSGSPRNTSVYTRAGHRNQRALEMPATARPMPSTSPMTLAHTVRIRVLGRPVVNRSGIAFRYSSQSRKESFSCRRTDFGATPELSAAGVLFSAIAAKSGRTGAGAALEPGFQPGGRARGTQSEYSFDHVPSAITASSPALRASINGLFSFATA